MKPFSPKDPRESITVSIDFANLLATGETISSASFTSAVSTGQDTNPSAMISGSTTVTGTICMQRVIGGLAGVSYIISAVALTNLGNTYVGSGLMPVQTGGA